MDSLTQIVLGAAVGEAVAGKKIGNRALLWGAIAGTIPDLDVIPGFFLTPLDNLIFHRGATHSILFCLIGAFLFAYLAQLFYKKKYHQSTHYKVFQTILVLLVPTIPAILFLFGNLNLSIYMRLFISISLFWTAFLLWKKFFKDYIRHNHSVQKITYSRWVLLFFLGFLTHTLLDCFTTYGTQLLWPFLDTRISWDVINVVDPFYTIWFLICLFMVMITPFTNKRRQVWNWIGISISSFYLILCMINKNTINNRVLKLIADHQIDADYLMTTPTTFNNLLWYIAIISKDTCYTGHMSIMDSSDQETCIKAIQRENGIESAVKKSEEWQVLNWFSGPFYSAEKSGDSWVYRDLRFGTMDFYCDRSPQYVFEFKIEEQNDKETRVIQTRYNPGDEFNSIWLDFMNRLKGYVVRPN